jgi:GT2 family glycosyltransferase
VKKQLSVVIPACDRAGLVGKTLRSIFQQTLPADEIIVVDDGSSDGTEEAAWAAFHRWEGGKVEGKKSPEFKVIRQENAGPGAARNRGFAESKGQFIHFFDSDDIAAPNKHGVQVRALQETGADIAYGPWVKGRIKEHEAWSMEHGGEKVGTEHGAGSVEQGAKGMERGVESGEARGKRYSFEPEGHVLQQKGLPQGDLIKELLTRWSVVPQTCLFRRSIVEKSGGFPDDMFVAEDQLLFLRCLLAGARVVHTPETLAFYRLGEGGKLTESSAASSKRVNDWSLFLRRAKEECRAKRIYPEKWLGFRRRVWAAEKGCAAGVNVPAGQHSEGSSLSQRLLYPAIATAERWLGGAKVRLSGNRQNVSFRCGPITLEQIELFPSE